MTWTDVVGPARDRGHGHHGSRLLGRGDRGCALDGDGHQAGGARLLRSLAANRARQPFVSAEAAWAVVVGSSKTSPRLPTNCGQLADKLESESAEDDEAGVAASSVIVTPNWRGYTDWDTSDEVR